jgi:hypothetical protein
MNRFLSRVANVRNVSRKPLCLTASFAAAAGLTAWAGAAPAANTLDPTWDTCADTWVATDGLGRSLPLHDATGPPKANRSVGIFYFLWNEGQNPVYDLTKIIVANPDNPQYGPVHSFHHWGEPLLGYYKQDDRHVLRKHMQMLADAGVDVLLLDVTNALTYDSVRDKLLDVLDEMQASRQRVPAIAFLANSNSAATVERLYQTFYKPGKGRAHWFPWLNKPLLLSPPDGLSDEVRAFFSIRHSWAWTKGQAWFGDGRDKWPWLDHAPQTPGWHEAPDKPEQITVCVAQHPISAIGRSYHNGSQPPPDQWRTADGLCFAEQWKRALEVDPPFVMITGWNEWIAQRFIDDKGAMSLAGRKLKPGASYFVDTYSQEFSRDIEPMKGGFGDAYYYQMVGNIRRYKGTREQPEVKCIPVRIDGHFADWAAAYPVYRDTLGDPVLRNHPGWQNEAPFINTSGRNDLAVAKVSADDTHVFFYIRTRGPLSEPTGPNWMLLYIDADHNPKTGWLGYDFVVNRSNIRAGLSTMERNQDGAYRWGAPADVAFRMAGNELEIAIPRAALGLTGGSFTIDFKWADNIQQTGEWSDFTLNGDAAPNDRCNFRAKFSVPPRGATQGDPKP